MLRRTFRVRSTLRHFRSAPFQTATRLLYDSDDSPSTYHDASIDHRLNKFQSDMSKATDDKIKSLGDKLATEIKFLSTNIDARFEISDAKTQSKFDVLRVELRDRDALSQSRFDALRVELRDREARFWVRVVFTVVAIAGITTSAAFLQYQNRAIQTPTIQTPAIQTPAVQTPAVQAPTVGQK